MKTFATMPLTLFTLAILIIGVLQSCTYQYIPPSPLAIKKYQERPVSQKDALPPRGHLRSTTNAPDYVEFQTPDQPRARQNIEALVSVRY